MPELSVVVPTFNEVENVGLLVERLHATLGGLDWEVVFVDDNSPDGTPAKLKEMAQADAKVRAIRRVGRRGLSSAVIEGILSSSAPYVAVMDSDLQHDERVLPDMLRKLKTTRDDVVVASRYVSGGSIGSFAEDRARMSRLATRLAQLVTRTHLSDPMSGFFMLRREVFENLAPSLSGQGFKILLDLLASAPKPLAVSEIPFVFRNRIMGESKLDTAVMWEYGMLLADKTIGKYVPPRFVLFGLVGGVGFVVQFLMLTAAYKMAQLAFVYSNTFAVVMAMTSNFFLNNFLTYRDQRLKGWRMLTGLASFYAVGSVGALANVGIAQFLYGREAWWIAAAAGVIVGSVWNFAASSVLTWRKKA
jgi:dolichol-phosphate mannosyltransferase